jgi:ATP-dependent DNA helicase RecG
MPASTRSQEAEMTREELLATVADLKAHGCEADDLEVKTASGGTPKRLDETFSAFANTRGGILIFGLNEYRSFKEVGVQDAQQLQKNLADLAQSQMEPAVTVTVSHHVVSGVSLVVAEVEELSPALKPCHHKGKDAFEGSYLRIGNTTQRMTQYQVWGYLSARAQPTFDAEPVPESSIADLDIVRAEAYVERIRVGHPRRLRGATTLEECLLALHITALDADGTLRPTRAGLLMFGSYPQALEPQLVITFLQYAGVDEHTKGLRGERFVDNRKFEGPIPDMLDEAVSHIMGRIGTAGLIDGLLTRDIPEYPRPAVREALLNAVAHRDYSGYMRGSQVQVKLFADRLEISSPGGLFGDVTLETLEEKQSTRNQRLMQMMEDHRLVDNRGTGIDGMISEMRDAHLEPPRFSDDRSYFRVTFYRHTLLLSGEGVSWLNSVAASLPISDRQRLALLYLRHNARMTNSDYRRLHRVDSRLAGRELQELVTLGAVDMRGVRGGAHYVLTLPITVPQTAATPGSEIEQILDYVRENGFITNSQCRRLLGVSSRERVRRLLGRLVEEGHLERVGQRRGSRYVLREPAS